MLQSSLNAYLTIQEVADYMRISKSYAYDLARRTDFPCIRLGRAIRVPISDLQDWVKSQIQNGQYGG